MMYGTRDVFEYFECLNCGCLQIASIPENLGDYYKAYYSLNDGDDYTSAESFPKSYIRHARARYCLTGKGLMGRLITRIKKEPEYLGWLRRTGVGFGATIADLGCGYGKLLLMMRRDGFCGKLLGFDPYLGREYKEYRNGVYIARAELSARSDQFDLLMMNHSFEHMPDPVAVMRQAFECIRPGCYVLIRIPIVSSFAWRQYGINWVQLDAPRHLYLHSAKSLILLAEQVGFVVKDIIYDSTEFQFWGSEQYLQDIPRFGERSWDVSPKQSIFTQPQIREFARRAIDLNASGEGDQACFYLYRPLG